MDGRSTTVEIILYYLTKKYTDTKSVSTTVEIILYYLTSGVPLSTQQSTTVEIILYYLTVHFSEAHSYLQQ